MCHLAYRPEMDRRIHMCAQEPMVMDAAVVRRGPPPSREYFEKQALSTTSTTDEEKGSCVTPEGYFTVMFRTTHLSSATPMDEDDAARARKRQFDMAS